MLKTFELNFESKNSIIVEDIKIYIYTVASLFVQVETERKNEREFKIDVLVKE